MRKSISSFWVSLPGYRPHASTIHEWNVGQSLKNPYVTPYYLMRRAYRPHGDGSYSHGIMALNLLIRLDYAVADWLGLYGFIHQFDTANSDGRDALDANTNPESLKDLTIFGVGAMVKF